MAPNDARKAYEQGLLALRRNKPAEAAKDFERAVARYPEYADAWVSLGKVRVQENAVEPAREAFLKAAAADPKMPGPYVELGFLAAQEKKWDAAGEYLDKATRLDPVASANVWYVDAVVNFNLRKFDASEKSARRALELDPSHTNPRARYLLAMSLIEKHNYPAASMELRSYLEEDPNAPDFAAVKDRSDRLDTFIAAQK
jgi:tetratricopeptide (TPR) repeat protein